MNRHLERQKLLNRLNLVNELLCEVLDEKIKVMEKEKQYRSELLKLNALLVE